MSNIDSYIINLRDAQHKDIALHFKLDNDFFESIGQEEFLGGAFQVDLNIAYGAGDTFTFRYTFEGHVEVPCDRCLEKVSLNLSFQETIQIGYGDEDNNDGDATVIPFSQLTYDTAMDMYELIVLNLPLQRIHLVGGCNADMLSRFSMEEDSEDGEINFN